MAVVQPLQQIGESESREGASTQSAQGRGEQGEREEKGRRVGERVRCALDELADALEENARDHKLMARRIRALHQARESGASWESILSKEQDQGTMQLLSQMLGRLSGASGALRKEMVYALRDEGVSVPTIARLFGVTHQRVSNLLRRGGS